MPEDTFRWVITGAVAISTLCIFAMAVIAFVMYRVLSKMQVRAEGMIDRVEPITDAVQKLMVDNGPRFSSLAIRAIEIADNAKDISDVARDQAHRFAEVGRDVADRARAQVARVDAAVDDTVEQVHHAGANLKEAALKPVREASGVIAGVKAAVSTYAAGRRTGVERITQDEEMFI
jgi:methyl-accepting chemotaxis protein